MSGDAHRMGPRGRAMRHLVLLIAAVCVTSSTAAWGYWTAPTVVGGNGAAAATSVDPGVTPTSAAVGQSVTVSWSASSLANGQAVAGYLVKRYDADTLAAQTVGAGCSNVSGTSCTETGVPAGSWRYSVTPTIGTNWRGAESGMSTAVAVVVADITAPANSLSLSVTSGDALLTGTTVYYRGTASGELRLRNAVADTESGPASSATSALSGTAIGWTHTGSTVSTPNGGPFVSNAFTWSTGTTTSPQVVVTGRDVAGNSTDTTLTLTNDSTAPVNSTISYADGSTSGASVSVSLTTGTDDGAGVGTRRLQRASAPLSSGVCGTFSSFANLEPSAPASPYKDSNISGGTCYRYQYVVSDKLGNKETATSASVVKVDYASAVSTTSGLVSHWRLGEAAASMTSYDSMTGANGALMTGRAGEVGATWTLRSGVNNETFADNRVYRGGNKGDHALFQASATPSSADYSVEADLHVKSNLTGEMIGVVGRLDPSSATYYMARWEQADTSWNIVKVINGGTPTYPGFVASQGALTVGQNYRIRLEMAGTSLKLYVNGVLKVSATDTGITAAGRAGFLDGNVAAAVGKSSTTGLHLDNFQVLPATYPRAADSKGSNTGDFKHGPTLGVSGALAGDANTAARFDGINDYVQATGTTGLPTGATSRSVEAWFRTTNSTATRQVLFTYGSISDTQEFGLWLNQGAASLTAWGFGEANGHNKVFNLPARVDDGAWHHVVKTYDGTSLTLYIDGMALPAQAATRNTVIDHYGFSIGAVLNPATGASGSFFDGSIDEVALYNTVLTATTVTDHYQLGKAVADTTGPTGGSVDATGLVGTGSRYSTSTTLSIALAKGTDPSGLGASGAELRRATATLSDGACGTYGAYALGTGGTDPSSPYSDSVADQACYRYEYVVPDVHGNTTTYTSPDIKVDTTAPSAPALSFTTSTANSSYWSGTGSTVWYRPSVSGSFVASASGSTDAGSGVATYLFPELGTGWTATAGTGTTYSWTANPTAPGTRNVTARNNASLVSTGTGFTPTPDGAAPTAGTVTYTDGGTSSTSVSVSFTTGTDADSGIGTRLLQRASATLTDATCGAFGAFETVTGGTNPSGPVTDTGARSTCYQYRYLVRDNVGNEHVATSGNVVKVWPTYLNAVSTTTGLVNYYRLGQSTTSADTFTGSAGVLVQNRSGETGASWTKHASSSSDAVLTDAGRVRKAAASSARSLYFSSATPASADYTVEADVHVASNVTDDIAGVVGRMDPTNTSGTFYLARYEQSNQKWNLFKVIGGAYTYLGQSASAQTLTAGTTYRVALDMTGSTIRVLVNGVQHVSVADAGITAAGRGGIVMGFHATASTTVTDTAGLHLDNFTVNPPLADSKGTNHGDYFGGVTLGVAGAVVGDTSTAAQFDGVNDFGTFARQVADDFSLEFWFKSTQGIGTGTQWWNGAGLVDGEVNGLANDFGVSLRSDGKVVAGVGNPDTSIVSSGGGYNDGVWHHVVFTRTKASGALVLYVDGVQVGTATGNTLSLTGPASLNIGRLQTGVNYFQGTIDEVAIYSTVLSAGAVTAHNGAAR